MYRREELALNIDLAPTFLDIAGAKPNKIMDGTSLMDVAVGTIYNSINGFVILSLRSLYSLFLFYYKPNRTKYSGTRLLKLFD